MVVIKFPSDTVKVIDGIRNAIGRQITLEVTKSGIPCPTCGINPVTNDAINPFCPTCSGVGHLFIYEFVDVIAHITWGHNDLPNWITGGQYFTGDCIAQIKYTDDILSKLDKTNYVYIDKKKMRIMGKILRGVPSINRILLDLKQED